MCDPLSWTTVPYRKSIPVRILVRGTYFWYEIHWNGRWYGFLVQIFISTVPDTDFGMDSKQVRYMERIFSVRFLVRSKIKEIEKLFLKFSSFSPYRNGFFVPNSGPYSVPIKVPDQDPYSVSYQ